MIGARLGPYEVTARLGEGGMGEVYRATDTRLRREVAIKVLPALFDADPDRLARFEREAQVLAQLHHPNIASVFGLEESGGTRALVMELVEGPTLGERLAAGALPVEECLGVALQIARALEEAHDKGIVHRDLKPQNVKAPVDGTVKVLDFGLAKALDPLAGAAQPADPLRSPSWMQSPTLTGARGTELGMILGTAAYMSPEQAKGAAVDRRADIWAFGVVLWEMLTGRRLFEGESATEILAGVLRQEIDLAALPAGTPPAVLTLLRRCLDRDPKSRLRDIGEARLVLAEALAAPRGAASGAAAPPGATASAARPRPRAAWLAAAGVAGLLAGALTFAAWSGAAGSRAAPSAAPATPVRFTVVPPEGTSWQPLFTTGRVLVSPDGTMLLLLVQRDGERELWLRPLDQLAARPLAGTEGSAQPFWSPDSRAIGFRSGDSMVTLEIATGRRATVCRCNFSGPVWSPDGRIRYESRGKLFEVAASGGEPVPLLPDHTGFNPWLLPGGTLLYEPGASSIGDARIRLAPLDGGEQQELTLEKGARTSRVQFVAPDTLLYVRDHSVVARRLDAQRGELAGEPVVIAEGSGMWGAGNAVLSASANGVLAHGNIRDVPPSRLTWFGRDGRVLGELGPPGPFWAFDLSPDERHVVVERADPLGEDALWIMDAARGTASRLTSEPAAWRGIWSPDGRSIVYCAIGPPTLSRQAIDAPGPGVLLGKGAVRGFPGDWTAHGDVVAFHFQGDAFLLAAAGAEAPRPFLVSSAFEESVQIRRDGTMAAYVSDEPGTSEVYVTGFPRPGERVRVSLGGARNPRWSADGSELFFLAADGAVMAAPVAARDGRIEVGAPLRLFAAPPLDGRADSRLDVTGDGQRFLLAVAAPAGSTAPVTVVLNWAAELPRRP